VLTARGFLGLTVRAVAAELGTSTSVVTHYFASKRELTAFALDLLDRRSAERPRRSADPGLPRLRAALLDMLPLDAATAAANRIWVASWDAALSDEGLRTAHAARYRASRERLAALLEAADHAGHLRIADPPRVAELVHAAVLGLVVQALLDPGAHPPERQVAVVEEVLANLERPRPVAPG
jgi:AcrR family transcriptional regulator